jgi:plastocyanin domain-containing protein
MKNRITTLQKVTFFSTLAGFGFLLGAISGVMAAEMETQQTPTQFQPIAQPIENKIGVTLGGLGLIGAELWWFVLSKPKSRKASTQGGVQEVTVTVDGGYEPSQIVVQAGQPVRLNFYRKDPSSCLEEVRLPDFRIAQQLVLNQTTPVEFTPDKPGRYEFACGMNMFRGFIEVQEAKVTDKIAPLTHS